MCIRDRLDTAKEHIEGKISIDEAQKRIQSYYEQRTDRTEVENDTKEADIVSARIAKLLGEKAFQFSPAECLTIHRRLFDGVFSHAGQIRQYNITKREWVLKGDTVTYAAWKMCIRDRYRGENDQPDTLHLYAYCANNPINYTDPTGHFVWKVVGAVIVGTAAYKLGKEYGLKSWRLALCTAVGAGIGGVAGHFLTPLLKPVLYIFVNWGSAIGVTSKVGKFKLMFHWNHHGKGYHVVLQKLKTKRWRTVFEKGFKRRK